MRVISFYSMKLLVSWDLSASRWLALVLLVLLALRKTISQELNAWMFSRLWIFYFLQKALRTKPLNIATLSKAFEMHTYTWVLLYNVQVHNINATGTKQFWSALIWVLKYATIIWLYCQPVNSPVRLHCSIATVSPFQHVSDCNAFIIHRTDGEEFENKIQVVKQQSSFNPNS